MAPTELSLHGASRANRSHSISSDRPSLTGYGGLLSPPVSITPEPAFVAASAASQIVTNDHDSRADVWFDQHGIEPSGETALVAPPALKLVNRFLDQLLFNFLSISKSTSFASLRPAVGEVLKPKLAREAISGADQELHEYLGGGDDEELLAFHNGLEPSGDWDLELVWKRTRLRCMVYSSLGDMEEEDEDLYTEQEQLDGPPGSNNRFSNNPGVVSPAVAIFLTSILEFMGEQVLLVAGQAAYQRLRAKHEREDRDGTSMHSEIAERVVVEEADMERVALDRTLGRLWRGWKKRIRSPTISVSRSGSFSRESLRSPGSPTQANSPASTAPEDNIEEDPHRPSIDAALAASEYIANIPLPMSENDVREIEIPGLAAQSDDEDDEGSEEETIPQRQRPKSVMVFPPHPGEEMLTPTSSQPNTPLFLIATGRKRSHSLPSAARSTYTSPSSKRPKIDVSENGEAQSEIETAAAEESSSRQVSPETDGSHMEGASKENEQPHESKGVVPGVIAGAAAMGAAAVVGIAAAANGQASQTETEHTETDVEEEFSEEPQIMTSSRVSISGRGSPDTTVSSSRQASVRANSVHSLRLIDVSSIKSPSRSQTGSVDTADYVAGRPGLGSRPSSVHSPIDGQIPPVASPLSRSPTSSPLARSGSQMSSRAARNSPEASISEEREVSEAESAPLTAVPTDTTAATQGVDGAETPTSYDFVPQDAARHAPFQTSAFVLAAPPVPRNVSQAARSNPNLGVSSKASGLDGGVPPLTPLREMMEGAPDTSDEASSIAPSQDAYSISDHELNGHTPSISGSSLAHTHCDPPRSIRPQATSIPRSSPPRSSRDDQTKREQSKRAIHTSASSSSHKLKPVRTLEERPSSATEDKGQSFEQLIRSDQTIQYTLTPQNMRNIEGLPESPRFVGPPMTLNSQDVARPSTSRSHSSTVSKVTGLHSNPPVETPRSTKSAKLSKPSPAPAADTGARLRPNAPQPRDARVERESMGDLAEFISSTAPPGSYKQPPPQSAPTANGNRGMGGPVRNVSGSTPRTNNTTTLPRRAELSARRSRLQARDAVVPRGDSISDLIDFVRSGPQLEKEAHRIPRTVAPFRTTMDSDQMVGAVGGKAIDASLPYPRYSQASASVNSSINSQSALISNSPKKSKPVAAQKQNEFDEEDIMPKRKTRRVRDMYQIDFSDEEEEYEAMTNSQPKTIIEESLAEFLANVPPPPDSSPPPLYIAAANAGKIKKKSSSPGLMSRFGRKDSVPHPPPKQRSSAQDLRSTGSRSSSQSGSRPPQLPTHTPIAVQFTSNKPATYEPARGPGSDYVSQLDTSRNIVMQKSYQPREAVYTTTRTNDLEAFLRSESPTSMSNQPQTFTPTLQREEASAFQRMFGRKKVH